MNYALPNQTKLTRILPYGAGQLLLADEKARLWLIATDGTHTTKEIETRLPADLYLRSVAIVGKEIWIATHSGIFVHNISNGLTSHYTHSLTDKNSLSDNTVYTLHADKEREISVKIGISSQSYFTKMFFKQFNVMPNEFAKQMKIDDAETKN